jgi:arsenate reductase (thioredoxin)
MPPRTLCSLWFSRAACVSTGAGAGRNSFRGVGSWAPKEQLRAMPPSSVYSKCIRLSPPTRAWVAARSAEKCRQGGRPVHVSRIGIILATLSSLLMGAPVAAQEQRIPAARDSRVLFVCEHGNVKSLIAMSYFNRLAEQRNLPYRAVSRGTAPDSTTVPPKIVQGMKADGFDVAAFHPAALTASDVSASQRVVAIGVALPAGARSSDSKTEKWDDVPSASVDFNAARDSLVAHVKKLLDQLARQ